MPVQPYRPARLAFHVFRGSDAVGHGLLTAHQLRSGAWHRLRHDVYGDSRLTRDHALACRAALVRLPPGTVVAGPSAAHLHGVDHAASFRDDVHVVAPAGGRIGVQQRLRVHHVELAPGDVDDQPGPPRTTATRTAWDVAAWLHQVAAVPIIDAMLARGLVDPDGLAAVADRLDGRPGSRRARHAFALADGASTTAQESRLRVRLVLDGLPRPAVRPSVRLPSGRVVHPDLAWPEHRVAIVYDGASADDGRSADPLALLGWIVLHVAPARARADLPAVLRKVRGALTEAGRPAVGRAA